MPEIPPPQMIKALRSYDLLPAIIFVPSRKRCDEAATEVALDKSQRVDAEKQRAREEIYKEFLKENPEIETHKHRNILLRSGVASHHAGHIPSWKFLIEKMMSAGLVNALFATSTVAAGVDFPARSVVISNADARGNDGWRPIEASELQQMTGRAGRRGKDNVGFVVVAPSNFQNPPRIAKLLDAPPDPLESKFRATYSSLLNLLDAFGSFAHVREIAEKSFAFRGTARQISRLERKRATLEKKLKNSIKDHKLGISVEDVIGFEYLVGARTRLQEKLPDARAEMRRAWLKEHVKSGRLVSKGKSGKQFYLVLSVFGDKVVTMRANGSGTNLSLSQIKRVYSKTYGMDAKAVDEAFLEIHDGKNPIVKEPKMSLVKENTDDAVGLITSLIAKFIPDGVEDIEKKKVESFLWESCNDAEYITKTARDIEYLKSDIWLPFESRARVLNHFGYLDFTGQTVTEKGKWLADLRIDKPLLVGEVLERGIFEKLESPQIAGLMASLAADSERDYGKLDLSDKLSNILTTIEDIVFAVSGVEWDFGVEPAEEINFSAAATAEAWVGGMDWADLVWETKAEEGDLVRLLSRTGEALMQVANLGKSKPEAAKRARITSEIILREPIR